MTSNMYWGTLHYKDWRFYLAATDNGLCYIGSPNQPFSELETWGNKKVKNPELHEDQEKLRTAIDGLKEYLSGKKKALHVPVDIIGTTFQKEVWAASEEIPYGETKTYQQIAKEIDNPKAVRAVGTAIGANPLLILIPCHRIVAKNGGLSGFRAGIEMKKFLLDLESKHA